MNGECSALGLGIHRLGQFPAVSMLNKVDFLKSASINEL